MPVALQSSPGLLSGHGRDHDMASVCGKAKRAVTCTATVEGREPVLTSRGRDSRLCLLSLETRAGDLSPRHLALGGEGS